MVDLETLNVIAVDGPAASGKSTVSQLVAQRLNFLFLDTGCMYRAVTYAVLQQGIEVADETAVAALAQNLELDIQAADRSTDGRHYTVFLNGQDITWQIRSPDVDKNVSQISSYLSVRQEMVSRQRAFGHRGQIVMVGRDIGTVVMPEAPLKFYITASAEERAQRRWRDRQQQGHHDSYESILADVIRRDKIDSTREHSPLRPAADAIILDTTDQTADEIVEKILTIIKERLGQTPLTSK